MLGIHGDYKLPPEGRTTNVTRSQSSKRKHQNVTTKLCTCLRRPPHTIIVLVLSIELLPIWV